MDKRLLLGEPQVLGVEQWTLKKINISAYEQGNVETLSGILRVSLRLSEAPLLTQRLFSSREADHFCLVENISPEVIIWCPQKTLAHSVSKIVY